MSSKDLVELTGAVPAWVQQYAPANVAGELSEGAFLPMGVLSIRGKVFRVKYKGDEVNLLDENRMPRSYIDVVIVAGSKQLTKAFYEGDYQEGSAEPPDCASSDGIKPDEGVPNKQCETCSACKWNRMGTARGEGKGKRCPDARRLAILPNGDLDNEKFGGPMLLRIPPDSLATLAQYQGEQEKAGRPFCFLATRLSFDPDAAHPRLQFKAVSWASWEGHAAEEVGARINEWRDSDEVDRILNRIPESDAVAPESVGKNQPAAEATATATATAATPPPAQTNVTPMTRQPRKPKSAPAEPAAEAKPNGAAPPTKPAEPEVDPAVAAAAARRAALMKELAEAEAAEKAAAAAAAAKATAATKPADTEGITTDMSPEEIAGMLGDIDSEVNG